MIGLDFLVIYYSLFYYIESYKDVSCDYQQLIVIKKYKDIQIDKQIERMQILVKVLVFYMYWIMLDISYNLRWLLIYFRQFLRY